MGFRLGMPSSEVLPILGRTVDLDKTPLISGKKILNDTIPFPECNKPFRRSVGFNSDHKLTAVGLTHKSDSANAAQLGECVLGYLSTEFGTPIEEMPDSITVYTWKFKDALITMDIKPYNERDWIVLVYYFERRKLDLN